MHDARRSLIVTPPDLGGLIHALTALEALADSGRRTIAFSPPEHIPLLRMSPAKPEFLPPSPSRDETSFALRNARCDEAVLLGGTAATGWLLRRAGISPRWGYGGGLRSFLLDRRVPRPDAAGRPADEDARQLLRAMGVTWPEDPRRLVIGKDLRKLARERLERAGIARDERPCIGLCAGTEGGSGRPWQRTSFEEVLRQLRKRHPRWRFVLLTSLADLWRAVRLHEETGKIHPVLGPDLKLDLCAAILAAIDLWVGGDSWMLPLAAAVGTPTVSLVIRDPLRWAPQGDGHRSLTAMTLASIEVDQVVEAVEAIAPSAPP